MHTKFHDYTNLKEPILKLEKLNLSKTMSSSNSEAQPMQLRTRTSTRTYNESLQTDTVNNKPKRRKSADSSNGPHSRSTHRSKSKSRSSSRARTSKAAKLYTKKDLDLSPIKTRSRKKTTIKTSLPNDDQLERPDIVEIETINTSFATCEYDIVEKSLQTVQMTNATVNENKSSEHRFEDDEIQDTKNREKNFPQAAGKDNKGCTYYTAGYLRFTTCKAMQIGLITLMFLVILTFLNNVYQFESLNKLSDNWPLMRSAKTNLDHLVDSLSNFLIELF